MRKKFLSLVIALIIAVSTFPAAFADNTDSRPAEVLHGLGFIGDYESEQLETPVTKADFARLFAKVLNVNGARWEGLNYTDIADAEDADVLYQMAGLGYVKAKSSSEFGVSENVTWAQALELTLRVLGYKPQIQANGNLWYAYCQKAREIGIAGNLTSGADDDITCIELYNLVYKALSVKLANVTVIRSGHYGEITEGSETLLSKYHDIYIVKGVVQAAGTTALSGAEEVKYNTTVDGIRMGMRRFDTRSLLGMNVEMFYLDVNSQKEAVFALPLPKKNDILKISGKDILSFNGKTIRYDNGVKAVSENIDITSADIIYNGKILRNGDLNSIFTGGTGEFIFIDNNGDGKYEVVVINRYVNYVVDRVNGSENKIYYKKWNKPAGGEITPATPGVIKLDDYTDSLVVDMQGYKREITELKEWDVISVCAAENSTQLITVYCPFETVSGAVQSVQNGSENKVTVNGAEYEFASSYYTIYGPGTNIVLGGFYVFRLDAEGKITAVSENRLGSGIQGFVINFAQSAGIDGKLKVRMLDEDGNVSILPCASKVKIDKETYSGDEVIKNQLESAFTNLNTIKNAEVARMVIYKINASGEITDIDTPYVSPVEDKNSFRVLPIAPSGAYGYQKILRRGDTFEGTTWIASDAKAFIIPEHNSISELETMTDDKFRTTAALNFLPKGSSSYVQAFAANDYSNVAQLVAVRAGGKTDIGEDTDMYLVNKVKTVISDGEEKVSIDATCIDEWGVKTAETLISYDSTTLNGYRPGDVIQIVKNNNGLVTYSRPVFYVKDPSTGKSLVLKKPSEPDDGQYTNYDEPSKVQFMSVYKREGDVMLAHRGQRILSNGSPYGSVYSMEDIDSMSQIQRNEVIFAYNTTQISHIFIFDTKDGKDRFTEATPSDIIDYKTDPDNYSNILLYSWWGGVRFVIIYK